MAFLRWLFLVSLITAFSGGEMDPNGGAGADSGPGMDPNGGTANSDAGPRMDPNGGAALCYTGCVDPNG